MKNFKRLLVVFIIFYLFSLSSPVYAIIPYETYTYDYNGAPVLTPHAYYPKTILGDGSFGEKNLNNPNDLYVDKKGNIYISDTNNNRILVLNSTFNVIKEIDSFLNNGKKDVFSQPMGVSVTDDGDIYIADSMNERIVVLDSNNNLINAFYKPKSEYLTDIIYNPIAIEVDNFGRMFVVAKSVNKGIISLDSKGEFMGFVGAQRVSYNPVEYMWKSFMNESQKERTADFIPTEYNKIKIDEKGFLFAVSSFVNANDIVGVINSKNKSGTVTPVKKINFRGFDVLNYNGYFAPVGDILYDFDNLGNVKVSSIVDIALGPDGTYCLLDHTRNKIFCYSNRGDLLFAFSSRSSQKGNSQNPIAIDFLGNKLLLLDSSLGRITIFEPTKYGEKIYSALNAYYNYQYEKSIDLWQDILNDNPSFFLSHDGMGRANMELSKYKEAMKYFSYSQNTEMYSKALKEYRDEIINKYIFIILAVLIVLIFVFIYISKYINKRNSQNKSIWDKFLYGFYLMKHPFKGFWDIKFEKCGSLAAATIIVFLTLISSLLQKVLTAKLFNPEYYNSIDYFNVFFSTVGIVLLFIIANWCFTSLMDGDGKLKDIYINVCYSLFPLMLFRLISIPLSYIITLDEASYFSLINSIGLLWTILLIFIGITVVHQFTFFKSILTFLLSIIGMAIITFILLLCYTTVFKIVEFIKVISLELLR